ncbi:glycosyl hydrolase [Nocardiopsis aegyptia]|uniref:glucan endo-1,3-beta-D-glucosidase n=1 Tax=Nocardiopsis aegyptia TaxID=220378 RepID=A0A7Z0ETH2_9ACTN|nr:glycosyl hydrolase [Nocardiopsis aegyptia]NYJ36943.1 endoglucanase Acf2 [Nocardiopsis aegyptia]
MQASRPPTARPPARVGLLAAVAALVCAAGTTALPPSAAADEVPVGSGGYTQGLPAGAPGASDLNGSPIAPKVTPEFDGPAPTNEWWSSLIFQRYPDNPYGENLFAHPLAFHAREGGLEVGYPEDHRIVGDGLKYEYPAVADLTMGVEGLSSPDTRVADNGDWTVTPSWEGGGRSLDVTIGQGLPFAYADTAGGDAQVTFSAAPDVWHEDGSVVGASVDGRHYALFAPSDTAWTRSGDTFTAATGADGYYSVAVLPSRSDLDTFAPYAYSFVTDSRVEYDYAEADATLTSTYRLTTEPREGTEDGTLTALYPHQWRAATTPVTDLAYASPRGEMRVVEGASFTTELTTQGVMPSLPTVDSADHDRMRALIDEVLAEEAHFPSPGDTYWDGKALGRLAQLVPIADSIGHTEARDQLLDLVKGRLEAWLSPGGDRGFHYDDRWGTMLGYPDSFGAATELNDHDFHYGYFVSAAAVVARYDTAWAAEDAWGGMVRLLIRDVAETDPDSDMFPRLRSFSPYAGHGWASGHAGFAAGNNQESSSEGMHFAAATALFGSLTGDEQIRDLGVYLHTTQASTVARYWQNHGGDAFPDDYTHDIAAMVWGDGADYRIWWDGGAEEHYGINYLPITAGSLYLGYDPEHAGRLHQSLVDRLGREPEIWRDVHWAHLALSDGPRALEHFEQQWADYEPEAGESKPHTYQWVSTLAEVGTVDVSVTADTAHYAVFDDGGERTHTAFNPGGAPITVTFSDGVELTVEPRSVASTTGEGGGGDDPDDPDDPGDPGDGTVGDGTFHLTPTGLSGSPDDAAGEITVASAGGANQDGRPPQDRVVLTADGLTGTHTGGSTAFALPVDSGTGVANAVQARVSYDLDGDGTDDRVETYRYFATNDLDGWEQYTHDQGLAGEEGSLGDMDGGSVRVELWSALGDDSSAVRTGTEDGATVTIPFSD